MKKCVLKVALLVLALNGLACFDGYSQVYAMESDVVSDNGNKINDINYDTNDNEIDTKEKSFSEENNGIEYEISNEKVEELSKNLDVEIINKRTMKNRKLVLDAEKDLSDYESDYADISANLHNLYPDLTNALAFPSVLDLVPSVNENLKTCYIVDGDYDLKLMELKGFGDKYFDVDVASNIKDGLNSNSANYNNIIDKRMELLDYFIDRLDKKLGVSFLCNRILYVREKLEAERKFYKKQEEIYQQYDKEKEIMDPSHVSKSGVEEINLQSSKTTKLSNSFTQVHGVEDRMKRAMSLLCDCCYGGDNDVDVVTAETVNILKGILEVFRVLGEGIERNKDRLKESSEIEKLKYVDLETNELILLRQKELLKSLLKEAKSKMGVLVSKNDSMFYDNVDPKTGSDRIVLDLKLRLNRVVRGYEELITNAEEESVRLDGVLDRLRKKMDEESFDSNMFLIAARVLVEKIKCAISQARPTKNIINRDMLRKAFDFGGNENSFFDLVGKTFVNIGLRNKDKRVNSESAEKKDFYYENYYENEIYNRNKQVVKVYKELVNKFKEEPFSVKTIYEIYKSL